MQKLPLKLYSSDQVKEIERIVIQEQGILGIELMRKAGHAVFTVLQQHFLSKDVIVFCGSGNNAGDGYVVARLALQAGFSVNVMSVSRPENLTGDAQLAYKDYVDAGGGLLGQIDLFPTENCIIVDALLGTGLNRDVSGSYADIIETINDSVCPVIAIDIPSGLNADTGNVMGYSVKADVTVCFIGLKQGLLTGFSAQYCGKIIFTSLDIGDDVFQQVQHASQRVERPCFPKRHRCSHKGHNGHVLLVGGDVGYSGAIILAAEAALRAGAGLVSVATRKEHSSFINMNRPEIMCHGVDGSFELMPLLAKASVVVIGPGLGQSQWAQDLLATLLNANKPLIVDADALNLLAQNPVHHDNWILTPHPGEAARLLSCSTTDIARDRFNAITKIQQKYGGVVLLKGAGTLINDGNELYVSTTGNPGMASGGMGDLLSGMIAALVAQYDNLIKATTAAVYVHGKAADISAEQAGEIGMIASDLLPLIRQIINK